MDDAVFPKNDFSTKKKTHPIRLVDETKKKSNVADYKKFPGI